MTTISLEITHGKPLPRDVLPLLEQWVDGYLTALGASLRGFKRVNTAGVVQGDPAGEEVWKVYPGAQNYEVSNHGRVRSLPRITRTGHRLHGRMLTPSTLRHGHQTVSISTPEGKRSLYVHRLVLETFVGPPPTNKSYALHNNGIAQDNRLENLRWGDNRENSHDKWAHGTQSGARLTEEQVRAIRADRRKYPLIAKEFGITVSNVQKIKYRNTWRHIDSKGVEVGVRATVLEQKESV